MPSKLTPLAKNLRKRATDTEQALWRHLRAKRFAGLKFKRQQPIGAYIADFVCFKKKVVVELDGGHHALPLGIERDNQKDRWFEAQGYKVLRFWDNEVLTNMQGVLKVIWADCSESPSPGTPPIKGGVIRGASLDG